MKNKIKFYKLSAAGNDFIFIDNRLSKNHFKNLAQKICTRRISIGADGLVFLEKISKNKVKMTYFNKDGSETFCGNASRSSAFFSFFKKMTGPVLTLNTIKGDLKAKVFKDKVKIQMPIVKNKPIKLKLNKKYSNCFYLNTGVPHLVVFVDNINDIDVNNEGKKIRNLKIFKEGTNVDFVQVIGKKIFIRTYERGVEEETLSCGTGITATGIVLGLEKKIKLPIDLISKSKEKFKLFFKEKNETIEDIFLEGPVKIIYEGFFYL